MLAIVLGLLAGAALLVVAGRAWKHVGGSAVTGRQLDDIPYALGLVGMAGSVAVLAAGRILRPVVGVVLTLVGIGAAVVGIRAVNAPFTVGLSSYAPLSSAGRATSTAWPWVSLAAAVLLALVGVAVAVRGNRWPGMGRRFEAPGAARPRPVDPQAAAWDALDRGEDPTGPVADGRPGTERPAADDEPPTAPPPPTDDPPTAEPPSEDGPPTAGSPPSGDPPSDGPDEPRTRR